MKKQNLFYFLAVFAVLFTTCKKEVADVPITEITLNHHELTLIPGDTITLKAIVQPENATNQNLKWASSNPAVVAVTGNGLVTAVDNGKANITVVNQNGNMIDSCAVTVDYRTKWLGDWDFVQYNYNFSFGWESWDTTYYSGKISLGKTAHDLNVNGRELLVLEDGLLIESDGPCGSFLGNNNVYLYFHGINSSGSQEWSINISGIKKKEF